MLKRPRKRKRRNQILAVSATGVIILVIAYALISARPNYLTFPTHTPNPSSLPGVPTIGSNTPINFHWHVHLAIFINGTPVLVPSDLGHVVDDAEYYAIHTHYPDGIIHIEYSSPQSFTLLQVFEVWGYPNLSTLQIFTYSGQSNTMYVNGTIIQFNPNYSLRCHDDIVIVYGSAPASLPGPYNFGVWSCSG